MFEYYTLHFCIYFLYSNTSLVFFAAKSRTGNYYNLLNIRFDLTGVHVLFRSLAVTFQGTRAMDTQIVAGTTALPPKLLYLPRITVPLPDSHF